MGLSCVSFPWYSIERAPYYLESSFKVLLYISYFHAFIVLHLFLSGSIIKIILTCESVTAFRHRMFLRTPICPGTTTSSVFGSSSGITGLRHLRQFLKSCGSSEVLHLYPCYLSWHFWRFSFFIDLQSLFITSSPQHLW
jgi:hypothetical protein